VNTFDLSTRRTDYHTLQSAKLKDLILKFDVYARVKDEMIISKPAVEQVSGWIEGLLEEVELLLKQVASLKKEAIDSKETAAKYQRMYEKADDGARKTMEKELRAEIDQLRQEKLAILRDKESLVDREGRNDRDNERLRAEIRGFHVENERLKARIASLTDELNGVIEKGREDRAKDALDDDLLKLSEEKFILVSREKKALEEVFEKCLECVHFPELRKALVESKRIQEEIDAAERAKVSLERTLTAKETELKLQLKRGQTNNGNMRKDIDALREELENCGTQLGIFARRRETCLEEVKTLNEGEKRRITLSLEMEKELLDAKSALQEYRIKFDDIRGENERLRVGIRGFGYERQLNEREYIKPSPKGVIPSHHQQHGNQTISGKTAGVLASGAGYNENSVSFMGQTVKGRSARAITFEPNIDEDRQMQRKMEEDSRVIENSLRAPKQKLKEKLENAKALLDDMRRACHNAGLDESA
jgi:hypothetical protein